MTPPITPLRCHTRIWNPEGDRRALLIHGLGSDGNCWWRLASQLAVAGFMVAAPDLRSHGLSPSAADHRLQTMAEDVALLGEAWDVVVGHSLGGAVAALLLTRPGFAKAGVLIEPVLRIAQGDHDRIRLAERADVGLLDPAAVAGAHPRWDARDIHAKVCAAATVSEGAVDAVFDDNNPWDVTGTSRDWTGARVTVLVADPAIGSMLDQTSTSLLTANPAISFAQVSGAGHSIHRDDPETIHEAVVTAAS